MFTSSMPPRSVCDRARQTRDARFDGLFFTAVRSTRIFCRAGCPAPMPKPENVEYFPSAAAATAAGYRPCLRCRPELSPEVRANGDDVVQRALGLIGEGFLQERSVESLAAQLGVSGRQLRRRFVESAGGATPLQIHAAHRLLLAKQLISDTTFSMTQVALAAGFASVRRFNGAFKETFGVVPSALRRRTAPLPEGGISLRLRYRPPFDCAATLRVLADHAIPGLESVTGNSYRRTVAADHVPAWICVTLNDTAPELTLQAYGLAPERIQPLVHRVRRMFDLNADLHAAHTVLRNDPVLAAAIAERPGLRIPGAWDGFEATAQIAIGLHTDARDTQAKLRRLVERYGARVAGGAEGLDRLFPSPDVLAGARLEDELRVHANSATIIRLLAAALCHRRISFQAGQRVEDFVHAMTELTGIDLRSARLVALRALADPDAFPVAENQLHPWFDPSENCATMRDLAERAEAWRPWRAYGVLNLVASARDEIKPGKRAGINLTLRAAA